MARKNNTLLWLIGGFAVWYFFTQNQGSVIPSNEPLNAPPALPPPQVPPGGGTYFNTYSGFPVVAPTPTFAGGVPPSSYAPPPSSTSTPGAPTVAPVSPPLTSPVSIGQPVPVIVSTGNVVRTPIRNTGQYDVVTGSASSASGARILNE